jgi:porin
LAEKSRLSKVGLLLLVLATCLPVAGQSDVQKHSDAQNNPSAGPGPTEVRKRTSDDLKQELDVDSAALSTIPADPMIRRDLLSSVLKPIDNLSDHLARSAHLKLGATYTFQNQYATITPDGVQHNQLSGRFDFTGAWRVYDNGRSAGGISMLVRSGTNIGKSQQFNLSERLGSGLFLNCLQGGGPQQPITLNILYWRQDLFAKKLSFYVGKIHPNEYISLSMFNNNETTQFLNGANDGNLAIASDGAYGGGAAMEIQATRHVYLHAVAVDTEGAPQGNIETLVDRKYMESVELGWFSGSPGEQYRDYRIGMWRDDTKNRGSGYGGGFGFEHEFLSGWAPFGRYCLSTDSGTAIKEMTTLGVAHVHPFGRRGDMFGAAFSSTEPSITGKHHESVAESFYRFRLTQSIDLGPDLEVSIHPTYAAKTYTTTLLGARMRVIF